MPIHYLIESKYWRRAVPNIHDDSHNEMPSKRDLVNTQQEFHNENPIKARKEAFDHYSSIIDVLYDGLKIPPTTDLQARIDLQEFLNSDNGISLMGGKMNFPYQEDMDNRIQVYAVINGVKKEIHGIRCLEHIDQFDSDLTLTDLEGLMLEYDYYIVNNQPTSDLEITINFKPVRGKEISFLNTPVNWKELVAQHNGLNLFDPFL